MFIGNVDLDKRCAVVADIGINHNGSIDTARQLIAAAAIAGVNFVKFQKRTVDVVYTPDELAKPREHPWGTTNGELKRRLEFDLIDYNTLAMICDEHGVGWFASCWDDQSVKDIEYFDPPCHKIASACLTDTELLRCICRTRKPIILSTGMSTLEEIDRAVNQILVHGNALVIMHCTSTYPSRNDELNLRCIPMLAERYGCPVGYSGHELGLASTVAAVAMGACMVERHITLDRSMFGSDQAASVEPAGFTRLVRDIRAVEAAMGDGVKRVYDSELPIRDKLRRVNV